MKFLIFFLLVVPLTDSYIWGSSVAFRQTRYTPAFFNQRPFGGFERPCGYVNPWGVQQWSNYCNNVRLFQRAGYLISKANLTQEDVSNLTQLAENWDIEGIKNQIYLLADERFEESERNESLQLLDELGPPLSFTDALEAFTIEQRGQVILLFKTRRYHDVAVITNGLIASLPDEDQPKYSESPYTVNGHCVIPNVVEKKMENDPERITLILHVSFNRLDSSIEAQISNWDGPISLAVVFPPKYSPQSEEVFCSAQFLKNLQKNDSDSSLKLSAHFLLQNQECSESDIIQNYFPDDLDCENLNTVIPSKSEKIKEMSEYPVNEARNLARNLSLTNFILIADMDHLFSKNFEKKMISLAKKKLFKDPKTVLVYRIFEVVDNVTNLPETKKDLLNLYKKNQAQEFHKYYGAHSIKDLQQWFEKSQHPENNTEIQFYQKYKSLHWEPQFVSLRTIPFHDTSFYYSTRDNTVLRWEMCRAGFKFAIVDDVFMFHLGIKSSKERKLVDEVRRKVLFKARQALRKFRKRMDLLYPKTKNNCPPFDRL